MMFADDEATLLRAGAAKSLARIRRDHARAGSAVKPLLACLEAHLLDRELSARWVRKACRVRDAATSAAFRAVTGRPLGGYIEDRRMETAEQLLLHSDLAVWQVASLLGFSGESAFARAFRRWKGRTPSELRQGSRRRRSGSGAGSEREHGTGFWCLAVQGALDGAEGEILTDQLHTVHRVHLAGPAGAVLRAAEPGALMERGWAEGLWSSIRNEPYEVQRATVLAGYPSPALFYLLLKKSREVGRLDRRRGEQLAELALASLEPCVPLLGDACHDLEALAWAWLGNARRLDLNYAGAEEAFARAEAAWRLPREHPDLQVQAQILDLKAALRMFQRRFAEAVQLEDRAIDLFRTLDNSRLLVPALILRASISAYRAQPRAMIPDLREARKHLESCDDARLELTVCNNLAYGYAVTGEHEAAAALLPQVKVLCRGSGSWLEWHQIQWVEGLLSQAQKDTAAAAQKFQEARAGFLELGEMDHAAVVALDEAILSAEQGRTKEVVELVTAALPAFEALKTQREAVAALRLVEEALDLDLSLAVLREARAHMERLRLDPSRGACCDGS